jgi:hypothetical protein
MPRNSDVEPDVVPADVWDDAQRVEGWLTREEANLLWRYASSPWCEVGTFKGRSARILSARGFGYCVDLFDDWYAADTRTGLDGLPVTAIRGDCLAVADRVPAGLNFLYLDAGHSFDETLDAFRAYAPKVKAGGHIALHDVLELHPNEMDWPGANSALHVLTREAFQLVAAAHRVAVFRV